MKIAKYIILLLLLITGTVSVFVATKDGSYSIKKNKIIDVPKDITFNYVSDLKNWDSINPWKNEVFTIQQNEILDNSTITRNLLINEKESEIQMVFSDTLNKKTSLTWITSGKMGFREKLLGLIGRGSKNDFENRFDEALTAINNTLTREINTFSVKLDGFIKRDTIFYIQRPIASSKEQIPNKIKSNLPQLERILISTGTASNGNPFIIYHSKDTINNKYVYSLAIPVKEKIYTTAESDIITGQINPSSTVKATLTGNYNHKPAAVKQLHSYMETNRLEVSDRYKEIEVLVKNAATDKLASKWVTEIYIPVRPKKIVLKPNPVKKDSLSSSTTNFPEKTTTN